MEDYPFDVGTMLGFETGETMMISRDMGGDRRKLTNAKTGEILELNIDQIRQRLGWKPRNKSAS